MKLTVNGKMFEANPNISVIALLKEKNVESPDMVSVEINGKIIRKEKYSQIELRENDRVEFLYFMGGG
jgi:sulfur carrier protein